MRTYEALYIVRPELGDEDIQTVVSEVETIVKDNGGTIVRSEIWGKRRLAYEVKKCNEGCYILLRFTSEPDFITRLESYFRLAESIIRSLVVHFDEQMLRLEAEQLKRKEEEILASAVPDDDDDDKRDFDARRKTKTVGMTVVDEETENSVVEETETSKEISDGSVDDVSDDND